MATENAAPPDREGREISSRKPLEKLNFWKCDHEIVNGRNPCRAPVPPQLRSFAAAFSPENGRAYGFNGFSSDLAEAMPLLLASDPALSSP